MIIKKNLIALSCIASISAIIAPYSVAQTASPALPVNNNQAVTTSAVVAPKILAVDMPSSTSATEAPKARIAPRRAAPVNTRSSAQLGPAITLEAPTGYVEQFKKEQQQLEFERAPKSISVVSPETAKKMELIVDSSYTSLKNSNENYSFTEKRTGNFLNNEEIDFSKSYAVIAQAYKEDVKLELKDIKPSSASGKFEVDMKPYFAQASSQECASIALYLVTKNLNNFLFPINNYKPKSCSKLIMVSDNGTYNADDMLINVSPMEQKKDHVVKVDITKDGWATKLQDTLYGQPMQLIMVNNNLDIVVAPQSTGGQFHYAKVQDIDYSSFKMTSPFVFKTRLDKQRTYRSIVVINNNGKFKYYPTTVFVEDLEAQFKNTSSQFK